MLAASNAELARVASCLLVAADPSDPSDLTSLIDLGYQLRVDSPFAAADVLQTAVAAMDRSDPRLVDVVVALGWTLADLGRLTEVVDLLDSHADLGDGRLDAAAIAWPHDEPAWRVAVPGWADPDNFDIGAVVRTDRRRHAGGGRQLASSAPRRAGFDGSAYADRMDGDERCRHRARRRLYLCEARAMLHGRDGS